jgi:arylsulfatase A-like enzyme
VLQGAGYRTACIGKWALGRTPSAGSPLVQGFDTYFGYIDQVQAHRHYPPFLLRDDERVALEGNPEARTHYSHDLFTDAALAFLAEPHERPFFLYLSYSLPHADIDVPADSAEPYARLGWPETPYTEPSGGRGRERTYSDQPAPRATFAGMLSRLDRDVGRLLARLAELELDERTLVLFTSDNGPSDEGGVDREFFDSNGPFRGAKGELTEGGIRVPLLARWPGRIAPGTSELACAAWDLLPTLAELGGAAVPADVDGLSLVPTLLGRPAEQRAHEYLYWEHFGPRHSQALRQGQWKALRLNVQARNSRLELYDLAADPGETRDLAADEPERAAALAALMDAAHVPSSMSPLTFRELRGGGRARPGKDR